MKETYILEIDSSQRDVTSYPSPNDYAIKVNRPLYNVEKIKLISGRIPLSQYTIDDYNNRLNYDSTEITLMNRNYSTGITFASNVQEQIRDATGTSMTVEYDSNTNTLQFSNSSSFDLTFPEGNSSAIVMGFVEGAYSSDGDNTILSNAIDLDGPTNIILSMNGDERDDIKTDIFSYGLDQTPMHYFGRITTVGYLNNRIIDQNGQDDPVLHNFFSGPENYIETLHIKFLCSNFDKVHNYDFKLRNHFLKFEITCNLDKPSTLVENKYTTPMVSKLPPAIHIPRFNEPYRLLADRTTMMYGGTFAILVFCIIILTSIPVKRK